MLAEIAKAALKVFAQHPEAIDAAIAALDKESAATHAQIRVANEIRKLGYSISPAGVRANRGRVALSGRRARSLYQEDRRMGDA